MSVFNLEAIYRRYIECLNERDWINLPHFVHEDVERNGKRLGIVDYQTMLENDYEQIPDLRFEIELLVAQPPRIACRLHFNVTPKGEFLGLMVNGRTVTFWENVFYEFQDGKIRDVRSVIDKAAIESQLTN